MSALDVLPREVLAKCLEFLSFDQAVEAKQVSKDVRSAARRALVVHWRPIKFVAEKGFDLVRALRNAPNGSVTVDAAALATFRAAWELDPGLVVFEIAQYSNSYETAAFLALVEPTIDGLPRVVAAIERTHRFKKSTTGRILPLRAFEMHGTLYDRVSWPTYLLVQWSTQVGRRLRLSPDYDWAADINQSLFILNSSQGGLLGCELFGSGLEAWADPELAADFVSGLVKRLEQETRVYLRIGDHERWTNHWQDRSKADKFMTAAAELLDREFIQHLQRVVNA